ncbi:MAG: putative RNA methyltransferase [Marinobacterium sp.]
MQLFCPVCEDLLSLDEQQKTLRCVNNHSFDRAKQRYWNLLLVQNKRSKDPGDNPEMIAARNNFLNAGYYAPVSNTLNELALQYTGSNPSIIDLGCGEGYYTVALQNALNQAEMIGLDISKHAIKAACKRSKSITWVVGSSANIPTQSQSLDLAVIVFSRILGEPIANALKEDGHLIIAYPGERHLYSLREAIYDEVRETDSSPESALGPLFERIDERRVHFEIELNSQDALHNLFMMTPHGQRAAKQLADHQQFTTEVDIHLAVFKKSA